MPIVKNNADANFYQMVHQALEQAAPSSANDRRLADRHDYVCQQQIAESLDWSVPADRSAFKSVLCYDLAVSGFSFLTTEAPGGTRLVVRLGGEQRPVIMRAEIVHVTALPVDETLWHKVGCRFVGRPAHPSW